MNAIQSTLTIIILILSVTGCSAKSINTNEQYPTRCDDSDSTIANYVGYSLAHKDVITATAWSEDPKPTEVITIASESVGNGIFREVHLMTFSPNNEDPVRVVVVNFSKFDNCIVDIDRVSIRILGEEVLNNELW